MNKTSGRTKSLSFLRKTKSGSNCSECRVEMKSYKSEAKAKKSKYNATKPQKVLSDLKNTACRGISSVKTGFGNLSVLLKITSPKEGKSADNDYNQLENNFQTPVKLYSPFGFETPSPVNGKIRCQRQIFVSPTGKLRQDVDYVINGFSELSMISDNIKNKVSPSNQ